jgi:Domain of unknown function (DUF4114)/PEP-CTERM motif
MNKNFTSALIVAAAALTGALSNATAASAFDWDSSWQPRQIFSKAQAGFNDQPFQKFVQKEGLALANSDQFKVNADNLFLKYDHDVKVSFINEGAGYQNQLGFRASGATNTSGLLFNDISCTGTGCVGDWGGKALKLGDTVKTGMIKGGTQLDFGLRANGFNRGANSYVFGTPSAQNPDGLQHVVAYTVGDRYLLLGFEDLYGDGKSQQGKFNEKSDRDFNDTVFVVDIGEANVRCLKAGSCKDVPEPAAAMSLAGVSLAAFVLKRRSRG